MTTHPFRKIIIHLCVYTVIILGIFAIQFRNQSIISKNFGQLRLSVSQLKKNTDGNTEFDDRFTIQYKGLNIYANNTKPVLIKDKEKTQKLQFLAWESLSDSSFELFFSHNVSLLCGFTGQNKEIFTITSSTNNPDWLEISIPYEIMPTYAVMQTNPKNLILSGKTQQTILNAAAIDEHYVYFTAQNNNLSYANYEPTKKFMFEEASRYALAKKEVYEQNLFNLRQKLFTSFDISENISETQVIAFIAEHLERGSYKEGLSRIPQSFLSGSKRSYLSSPYFNNLSLMQKSLMMYHENMAYKMKYAQETKQLDIFQGDSFPTFLLTQNKDKIESLLQMLVNRENFEPTLLEASGIIETYLILEQYNRNEREIIEPLLFACIETIQKACTLEDDKLKLIEQETKQNTASSLQIAKALISYGNLIKNTDITTTGYFIANSALENTASLTTQTIAELYPILVQTKYYPHIEILNQANNKPIWAWTSAKNLNLSSDSNGTITLRIEFPVGQSHYIIVHNIEAFEAIEIYEMFFRTDPRFETYDSSGYVYDAANKNLLLKVKNKTAVETIKLYYKTAAIETATETATEKMDENKPEA
ncbi:MAG TPA: hypothetical protein DDW88_06545 [Treponema sp.]|nr:hypothetical protein [Treponema sp.]